MKTKGQLVLCPAPAPRGKQAPSPPRCGPRRAPRTLAILDTPSPTGTSPCCSSGLAETPLVFMPRRRKEAFFPGLSGLEGGSLAPLVVNLQQRDFENTSLKELKCTSFPI